MYAWWDLRIATDQWPVCISHSFHIQMEPPSRAAHLYHLSHRPACLLCCPPSAWGKLHGVKPLRFGGWSICIHYYTNKIREQGKIWTSKGNIPFRKTGWWYEKGKSKEFHTVIHVSAKTLLLGGNCYNLSVEWSGSMYKI